MVSRVRKWHVGFVMCITNLVQLYPFLSIQLPRCLSRASERFQNKNTRGKTAGTLIGFYFYLRRWLIHLDGPSPTTFIFILFFTLRYIYLSAHFHHKSLVYITDLHICFNSKQWTPNKCNRFWKSKTNVTSELKKKEEGKIRMEIKWVLYQLKMVL